MIIKNIFKIHPLFYIVGFICFITGYFKIFVIFSSIILFHELGHIIAGLICRWRIDKIILLPFGGITIFKESLNKPLKEELFIALLGPLFQVVYFFIIDDVVFRNLNLIILLFNLLPIVPLDGSKLVNVFLNIFLPFKKSHILTIYISMISIIFIFFTIIFKFNILFLLILIFIFIEIIKEYYKHEYYFNKFLLERYLYNFNFKKIKKIKNIKDIYKNKKHIIYFDKKYCTERELLVKMFDK